MSRRRKIDFSFVPEPEGGLQNPKVLRGRVGKAVGLFKAFAEVAEVVTPTPAEVVTRTPANRKHWREFVEVPGLLRERLTNRAHRLNKWTVSTLRPPYGRVRFHLTRKGKHQGRILIRLHNLDNLDVSLVGWIDGSTLKIGANTTDDFAENLKRYVLNYRPVIL